MDAIPCTRRRARRDGGLASLSDYRRSASAIQRKVQVERYARRRVNHWRCGVVHRLTVIAVVAMFDPCGFMPPLVPFVVVVVRIGRIDQRSGEGRCGEGEENRMTRLDASET